VPAYFTLLELPLNLQQLETEAAQQRAEILQWLEAVVVSPAGAADVLQQTVDLIHGRLPTYNWVGFYMLDPADSSFLQLGPFAGAATPHTRIPVTEGICGAAVAQGGTVVVDDVDADPRYLSCSIETKSEIVVPIRAHGSIIGEIDIDSHTAAAFGPNDRAFVERCAEILTGYFESEAISK
jgi:L-methionine (R)-S-oxide reductase